MIWDTPSRDAISVQENDNDHSTQADHEISQKMDVLFVMLQTFEQHGRLIAALAT